VFNCKEQKTGFMKTVVLGASEKSNRYSNRAVKQLLENDMEVVAIGRKEGMIEGTKIITGYPTINDVHTITLYLNPENQKSYYDYIIQLKPQRVIFNPGTENDELKKMIAESGAKAIEACTLVLLSTGQY